MTAEEKLPEGTLYDILKSDLGFRFDLCPRVNGFAVDDIDTQDFDAPIILKFVRACHGFNVCHQTLTDSAEESAGRDSESDSMDQLIGYIDQKSQLDEQYAAIGIIIETDLVGGLVVNINYTSPRPEWNAAYRYCVSF